MIIGSIISVFAVFLQILIVVKIPFFAPFTVLENKGNLFFSFFFNLETP